MPPTEPSLIASILAGAVGVLLILSTVVWAIKERRLQNQEEAKPPQRRSPLDGAPQPHRKAPRPRSEAKGRT